MKKSKRLVSMFLAVLMLISCFGAMQASALTEEAAAQAAAEWNASCPDLSDVYSNLSAKEAESTMNTLDTALGLLLKQKDVPASIYTDENMTKLFMAIAGLSTSGSFLMVLQGTYGPMGFPKIDEALRSVNSFAELEGVALEWGITPGDSQTFKYALFPLIMYMDISGANVFGLLMMLYELAVIPIMESFHTGNVADFETLFDIMLKPPPDATMDDMIQGMKRMADSLLDPVITAIDMFLAHPITYLCDILPDLVYTYEHFGSVLSSGIAGEAGLPPLNELVATLLAQVGESTGIVFPELDLARVAHMGTAAAVPSMAPPNPETDGYMACGKTIHGSRVAINSNRPMVFAAILNYTGEVLRDKGNQAAIGRLITEQVGPEYLEDYDQVVAASQQGGTLAIAQAVVNFADHVVSDLSESEEASGIVAFFAKIAAFFTRIFKKILDFFSSLS